MVRLGDGRICGIVMEKANGKNVNKTLRDPRWVLLDDHEVSFCHD